MLEMDLGNKVAHMADIREKVDCVLDSKDIYSESPARPTVYQVNGNHVQQTPNSQTYPPQNLRPYEASTTYAPETLAATESMEASLPVPKIVFKPPQSIDEWNDFARQLTPSRLPESRAAPPSRPSASQVRHTPQSAVFSPSEVASPRSVHSHASSSVSQRRFPGHDERPKTPDRAEERLAPGRAPSAAPSGLSQSSASTYY